MDLTRLARQPQNLECGGKRSATPLWLPSTIRVRQVKAPSPLRSAGALHIFVARAWSCSHWDSLSGGRLTLCSERPSPAHSPGWPEYEFQSKLRTGGESSD